MVLFTISRFLILKLATDPISIENFLSAEIGQVTNFRGLKSDRWPILVMEIGSLNQPIVRRAVFTTFKNDQILFNEISRH